ncbi:hypothetical protein ACOMHN_048929 [Nucella lapillus]
MTTTATMQVFYSPPQSLLSKRKKREGGRPSLTVTIPFSFSTRLSRCDRRLQSACSIRRASAASLPRLPPRSARPSATTTSSTDNSGSAIRRVGSLCDTTSISALADPRCGAELETIEAEAEDQPVLSPEEEKERRQSHKKCLRWLEGLPDKFSGMHIVQPMVHSDSR